MTAGQERGWQQGFPKFGLTLTNGTLDWDASFGGEGRRVVEIGFGMGDSLLSMAQADPETQFVGIEVHRPGVGRLLAQVMATGVSNLRVFADDAAEVLSQCLALDSIDGIHIFFPDPWHKKRHHKRRLIQPPFVRQLVARLREGGYLHLATDWEPYAEHMYDVLDAEPLLVNAGGAPRTAVVRPDCRPLTKFEARGERLGHRVADLMYLKRAP
jgi:tRNA (guanine-N7-)-methyltransferase